MKLLCLNSGVFVATKKLTQEQQALAEKYWDLASWLCAKYPLPLMDWDEMHCEALMRICRAARTFKPELNIKFSTYAVHVWIHYMGDARRVTKVNRYGYFRTQEIAAMAKRENESELPMKCPDARPDEVAETREEVQRMMRLVAELPVSYRRVIEGVIEGKKYAELGREFGCSRERIRQIAQSAKTKLRKKLNALEAPFAEEAQ